MPLGTIDRISILTRILEVDPNIGSRGEDYECLRSTSGRFQNRRHLGLGGRKENFRGKSYVMGPPCPDKMKATPCTGCVEGEADDWTELLEGITFRRCSGGVATCPHVNLGEVSTDKDKRSSWLSLRNFFGVELHLESQPQSSSISCLCSTAPQLKFHRGITGSGKLLGHTDATDELFSYTINEVIFLIKKALQQNVYRRE